MFEISETYSTFDAALASCCKGVSEEALAAVAAHKTRTVLSTFGQPILTPEQVVTSLIGVSIAAVGCPARPLRVLDFGGAGGHHYFDAFLRLRIPMRWAVVEKPSIVRRCSAEFEDGCLSFHDNIDEAARALGGVDLVHSSGAIQYTPDPLQTTADLLAFGAPYFLLSRLPLWNGETTVGIQEAMLSTHTFGSLPLGMTDRQVRYPITFTNTDAILGSWAGQYEVLLLPQSPSASCAVLGTTAPGLSFVLRGCS